MATKLATSEQEKQVVSTMIDMYRKMPYLWKKDHDDYMNKRIRSQGYTVLLNIYRNWDEDCTVRDLKKKIDNLRSNYFRERKKVIASQQLNKVYIPTLWYYHLLTFLNKRKGSVDGESSQDPLEDETSDKDDTSVKFEPASRKRISERPLITEKRSLPLDSARKFHPSGFQRSEPWEITYGKSIGHQVKDLNPDQLVICQKLISDVIFFAKLNKLTEHSEIMNTETETTFIEQTYIGSD